MTTVPPALAQGFSGVMDNEFYNLQMGNLNSFAGDSSGSNYKLSVTGGELTPGLLAGENFQGKIGFQYVPRGSGVFTFSISSTRVDFGTLVPTNPVERKITLTVENPTAPGYQVTAAEDHGLENIKTKDLIPNTTCDNGTCTKDRSATWESPLTYGFGYRCDGISVKTNNEIIDSCRLDDRSFTNNPSAFRPFSDLSKSENATVIMKGGIGRDQDSSITYKVNIPTSQATGKYVNTVTYITIPSI